MFGSVTMIVVQVSGLLVYSWRKKASQGGSRLLKPSWTGREIISPEYNICAVDERIDMHYSCWSIYLSSLLIRWGGVWVHHTVDLKNTHQSGYSWISRVFPCMKCTTEGKGGHSIEYHSVLQRKSCSASNCVTKREGTTERFEISKERASNLPMADFNATCFQSLPSSPPILESYLPRCTSIAGMKKEH